MPDPTEPQSADKRRTRRAKITKPLRVRPSEPRDEHFEDLPVSVNASKDGIFFQTRRKGYYKGMRVFVTFPFTSQHAKLVGDLVAQTRPLGLSLGDRACLALGLSLKAPVYTADKSWKKVKVGARIHVIR